MTAQTRLKVDTDELTAHGTALSTLADTLDGVQGGADDIKEAYAYPDLATEVVNVSSQWDDKRRGLVSALRDMAGTFPKVASTFDDADSGLAKTIRDAITPATST